ncbi:MAG: hypothetical protein WBA36_03825 [Mesorhizobium sp.]
MSDNFFNKASAIVLTAAGVLGVGYGVAKYVTDFEAAKGEIQNLRGQIAQLHEVLSKVQFGADPARIERLEAQVNELGKAVTTLGDTFAEAMTSGANAATAPLQQPVANVAGGVSTDARLKAGDLAGSASDGKERWPFRIADVRFLDGSSFEAVLEWTTLDSMHRIEGDYSPARLFFKETEFLRKGKNHVLGCEYTLEPSGNGGLSGTFGNCDGNFSGGTVEIR